MSEPRCPDCQELADGLDGIHCQLCWEKLCSASWWEIVPVAQKPTESWLDYHAQSEKLVAEAEGVACNGGDPSELYRQAAQLEASALAALGSNLTKPRTIAVALISTVSLYRKAGDMEAAQALADTWRAIEFLPEFAIEQLAELEQSQ